MYHQLNQLIIVKRKIQFSLQINRQKALPYPPLEKLNAQKKIDEAQIPKKKN